MTHIEMPIVVKGYTAKMITYILDNSPEVDARRIRPMVVICPGGGYGFTSDREAEPVALQLNAMGFNCCVLRYSVAPAAFPTALAQLATAVATIRDNAEKWHVNTGKIFIMGFSAGGHLAASLGVFWKQSFLHDYTGLSPEQCRPCGLVLSYPVITSGVFSHAMSIDNLLNKQTDMQSRDLVSLEKQVSSDTPPTFMWHTFSDDLVPVQNTLLFSQALANAGIPFEMHIYPKGIHGLSLATAETAPCDKPYDEFVVEATQNWISMAGRWMHALDAE